MRFSCPKQCFQKPIKPTHLVSNEKQFAELFWFQLHFLEKCWYDSDSNRYIIVFTVHPFLSREAPLNWPWRGRGKILYIKRWIVLYYRWRRSCDKVFPTQKLLRNSNHPTKGIKIKFQGFSSWAFYNRNIINHLQYFLFFWRHGTWSSFWKSLSRLNISSEKLLPEFYFVKEFCG